MGNELQKTEKSNVGAYIWMILAVLYVISPIDIIPDVIPFAGWADDALALITGGLNLLQVTVGKGNEALAAILRLIKWIAFGLGLLIVLILFLIGVLIYKVV